MFTSRVASNLGFAAFGGLAASALVLLLALLQWPLDAHSAAVALLTSSLLAAAFAAILPLVDCCPAVGWTRFVGYLWAGGMVVTRLMALTQGSSDEASAAALGVVGAAWLVAVSGSLAPWTRRCAWLVAAVSAGTWVLAVVEARVSGSPGRPFEAAFLAAALLQGLWFLLLALEFQSTAVREAAALPTGRARAT
ncbi:MAG: hypothetical protein ACYDBQ_05575 [Thermoplasmatota archaeon]